MEKLTNASKWMFTMQAMGTRLTRVGISVAAWISVNGVPADAKEWGALAVIGGTCMLSKPESK